MSSSFRGKSDDYETLPNGCCCTTHPQVKFLCVTPPHPSKILDSFLSSVIRSESVWNFPRIPVFCFVPPFFLFFTYNTLLEIKLFIYSLSWFYVGGKCLHHMLVNGGDPPYLWHKMLVQEQHCVIYPRLSPLPTLCLWAIKITGSLIIELVLTHRSAAVSYNNGSMVLMAHRGAAVTFLGERRERQ